MHHKPLVYLREIDFTDLSYYKSKKYGISRAIYQYVGFTDEGLTKRTAKWSNTNLNHRNNKKTKFLRGLMKMYKFKNRSELNNFLLKHTIVLKEFDIKKEARKFESTMISINMQEDAKNKHIICLNERDAELSVKEINELAKSFKNKEVIAKLREKLEKEIIEFGQTGNKSENVVEKGGIWITTSVVEASLDIDFDVLYTEMSTADSLLQRMGRCNRKVRYIPDKANIHIYINANGVGVSRAIYNREIYTRSVECLEKYIGRVMTESDKSEYINKVYCTDEINDTDYYRDIEKFLAMFKELTPAEYSKSEADEKFRDINSIKIIPDDVYEDSREVISECIDIMHSSDADRREKNDARTKLDSYVISIQLYAYKKYPDGIDRDVIYGSDIHRSCIMYDFNVVDLTGAGLVLGEYERDIFV